MFRLAQQCAGLLTYSLLQFHHYSPGFSLSLSLSLSVSVSVSLCLSLSLSLSLPLCTVRELAREPRPLLQLSVRNLMSWSSLLRRVSLNRSVRTVGRNRGRFMPSTDVIPFHLSVTLSASFCDVWLLTHTLREKEDGKKCAIVWFDHETDLLVLAVTLSSLCRSWLTSKTQRVLLHSSPKQPLPRLVS